MPLEFLLFIYCHLIFGVNNTMKVVFNQECFYASRCLLTCEDFWSSFRIKRLDSRRTVPDICFDDATVIASARIIRACKICVYYISCIKKKHFWLSVENLFCLGALILVVFLGNIIHPYSFLWFLLSPEYICSSINTDLYKWNLKNNQSFVDV